MQHVPIMPAFVSASGRLSIRETPAVNGRGPRVFRCKVKGRPAFECHCCVSFFRFRTNVVTQGNIAGTGGVTDLTPPTESFMQAGKREAVP